MTRILQVRPFIPPSQWTSRLAALGGAMVGLGIAVAWNPIAYPGPRWCLLRMSVGLPCPACGLTRGVCLCARGRFLEATGYNPLAVPLCILAATLCVKWIFEIARKRQAVIVLPPAWNRRLWVSIYAVVLANWVYLLVFRREDAFASTWLGQLLHAL